MAKNELVSRLSGSIARSHPLENTPELQAMLEGRQVIASTWGDYATRYMDLYDCEPQEALDALLLSPEDLQDPSIYFQDDEDFGLYKNSLKVRWEEEARKDLLVEVRRLQSIVTAIMEGYTLPDKEAAHEQAEAIQLEINAARSEDSETEEFKEAQSIRCMERDALYDGVRIPLDEFIVTMLSCNVIDTEVGSELGKEWVQAIVDAVEDFWREHVKPGFEIGKMVAGKDIFTTMRSYLSSAANEAAKAYANERWARIEPIFLARSLEDLPLISGSDSVL